MFVSKTTGTPFANQARDPYGSYTSLLLHGNGLTGVSSSNFNDYSTGYIPFTNTHSYYFNGTNAYLQSTLATAPGTGSVTYECWFNTFTLPGVGSNKIMNSRSGNTTDGVDIAISSAGKIIVTYTSTVLYTSTASISIGVWYHVAVVRNGASAWTVYINGVQDGTFTNSVNITSTTFTVGNTGAAATTNQFSGLIHNVRVTNAAVYTSSPFTPPTAPLYSSNSSVKALIGSTHGINIDDSQKYMLTGTLSSTQSKFGTSSIYFDGTGGLGVRGADDASSLNYNHFIQPVNNFTYECWVYPLVQLNGTGIFNFYNSSTSFTFTVRGSTGGINSSTGSALNAGYYNTTNLNYVGTNTGISLTLNTWQHIATTYDGTTVRLFLDGVLIGSFGSYSFATPGVFTIGSSPTGLGTSPYFNGYMDEFRVSNIARYTSNFTPPTAPFANR